MLEIHLALLPAYQYLFFYVQVRPIVTRKGSIRGGPSIYLVGTEFALIMDDDREKLVQHNFKKQSRALRSQRQPD